MRIVEFIATGWAIVGVVGWFGAAAERYLQATGQIAKPIRFDQPNSLRWELFLNAGMMVAYVIAWPLALWNFAKTFREPASTPTPATKPVTA